MATEKSYSKSKVDQIGLMCKSVKNSSIKTLISTVFGCVIYWDVLAPWLEYLKIEWR